MSSIWCFDCLKFEKHISLNFNKILLNNPFLYSYFVLLNIMVNLLSKILAIMQRYDFCKLQIVKTPN